MEVGQKIKLVRLHRGLTQKQLGDLLNLGDGGANRIAQYEIGYRVPKPSLLKEIAKVLDVKEETFFVSDKYLLDILRTIMWYDFEHRRSFKLAEVTLDASIAPIESKTIELRGNACTTWGDSIAPAPATVLWMNVPLVNDLMREWLTRKQELASHAITKSEYLNGCSNGLLPPIWPESVSPKDRGERLYDIPPQGSIWIYFVRCSLRKILLEFLWVFCKSTVLELISV